jgi:acetyl-CoA carboxylase carboxyltransferase component/biotin carboxyl carrier protein
VEHTVTEEVTGVDLVQTQFRLAAGATLAELGLDRPIPVTGSAIQLRINCETMGAEGDARPGGGTITAFELPTGRGTRVDTYGYSGYTTNPSFDSLLAKLVVHRPTGSLERLADAADRAAADCRIEGVATNLGYLRALLRLPEFRAGALDTGLLGRHGADLVAEADAAPSRFPAATAGPDPGLAGARVDRDDPLAVLDYGRSAGGPPGAGPAAGAPIPRAAEGLQPIVAPLQGTLVELSVEVGETVAAGQQVAVMESMKMEHEVRTEVGGTVERIEVAVGDTFFDGHLLLVIAEGEVDDDVAAIDDEVDLDQIRDDLAYIVERHELVLDANRPRAVERRRATGHRTARENVAHLVDDGSFVEYGPMVVAAQKSRRSMEDLLVRSPADGLITGVGSINGDLFDDPVNRCAVMAYDYTVFAGTQGIKNHAKTDRILQVARQGRMPFILFGEGGGGRPGDTDGGDFGTWTFNHFAAMSGLVPMIGITTGFCFAGNASILGCCDVIIATEGSNIGMGGPAMVEGGGLGVFRPEEIGPLDVQRANGVVDIVVADEAEAVEVAKRYLGYFQGPLDSWEAHDQRRMRPIVPENRLRVYDVREVIDTIADVGSVLELRPDFGVGIITSLIRIEGRPLGVVANNPLHLGGAIDADGSDKGARFMQLCDAFDVPLLFLCDTPGIMVGPEVEKTALVRKSSRMFVTGANVTVPSFAIILRKAYGLGAVAMSAASFKQPMAMVSWPTGEFGPMGLEGAVKLGFRDELAAIDDPEERRARYDKLVDAMYARGKGDRLATAFAVDDTIDPADSRRWVANLLAAYRPPPGREGKKRPWVDAW